MIYKLLLLLCGMLLVGSLILGSKWFVDNMCLVDCELTAENDSFAYKLLEEAGVKFGDVPSEYDDNFAEEIIAELITEQEAQILTTEGAVEMNAQSILFDYGEKGKTLSLQKYFDSRSTFENPLTKSVVITVDRPDNLKLRHKIEIGTDMAKWEVVKKESSDSETPFKRVYVLVQRNGERQGRMVGLSYYEGSNVKIEYEGQVDETSIKELVDITESVSERHGEIYNKSLQQIAEGPLFVDDPIMERPDLPDPDLD